MRWPKSSTAIGNLLVDYCLESTYGKYPPQLKHRTLNVHSHDSRLRATSVVVDCYFWRGSNCYRYDYRARVQPVRRLRRAGPGQQAHHTVCLHRTQQLSHASASATPPPSRAASNAHYLMSRSNNAKAPFPPTDMLRRRSVPSAVVLTRTWASRSRPGTNITDRV